MGTGKEIEDFPLIINSEFDTSRDVFLLPGDGTVYSTNTVVADAVLDNIKQQGIENFKQIKDLGLLSYWEHYKLSDSSTNIVDEWVGLRQESNIRTYDLSSFGVPASAKAVYVKIFVHGSYPALHMTYYKSATATSGHTMNNLTEGQSRAAAEAWQLWMPVEDQKIFIQWRYARATVVKNPAIVQLMISAYI
tara:strand:+ start:74 stop:649 length:576 start_codon:yes stop_codon:yes gene_type:complete